MSLPPSHVTHDTRRPGRLWYFIGLLLIVGGVSTFVASLTTQRSKIADQLANLPRLTLPEGGVVVVEEAGVVQVFYEGSPTPGEERVSFDLVDPVLKVVPADVVGAEPLTVMRPERIDGYPMSPTFHGYAMAQFLADAPGRFHVSGTLAHDDPTPATIAVGRFDVAGLLGDWTGVFGGAVAATLGLVVGTVMLALTYLLRHGHRTHRDDTCAAQ